MHLRVTETAEASLAEAVAEASNKATVVVLRYMAWQRYHFHWAKHNGSGEFIAYSYYIRSFDEGVEREAKLSSRADCEMSGKEIFTNHYFRLFKIHSRE